MNPMKPKEDKGKGKLGGRVLLLTHSLVSYLAPPASPHSVPCQTAGTLPLQPIPGGAPWAGPW